MSSHVWEWLNGKSFNRYLVAGIVIFVAFRSGVWTFARQQISQSQQMNQNSKETKTKEDNFNNQSNENLEEDQVKETAQPYVSGGPSVSTRSLSKNERTSKGLSFLILLR